MVSKNNIKLSIIIPTYNRATFLPRAIKSIQSQRCSDNIEIIIIDDGSTDNTSNVIFEFKDRRIVYFKFSENKGVNYARNKGIEIASGDWIGFLDSDDEYLYNAFQAILKTVNNIDANIDVVGFINKEIAGDVIREQKYIVGGNNNWKHYYPKYEDIVLKRGVTGDIHYYVRRKIFNEGFKFPEKVNGFESLFFSNLAKNNKKFVYINETVVLVHTDSSNRLSVKPYLRWPKQYAWGYKKFVKDHYQIFKKYPEKLLHYYLRIAKCYYIKNNPRGLWWSIKAFIVSPTGFLKIFINKIKN